MAGGRGGAKIGEMTLIQLRLGRKHGASAPNGSLMRVGWPSAPAPQARVGLELADHGDEVVEADDPLELEPCAVLGDPDAVGFDPTYHRQTDDHPIAAREIG